MSQIFANLFGGGGKKYLVPIQIFFREIFSDKFHLHVSYASRIGWWVYEGSELKGEKVKGSKVVKNLGLCRQIALMKPRPSVTVSSTQRCRSTSTPLLIPTGSLVNNQPGR